MKSSNFQNLKTYFVWGVTILELIFLVLIRLPLAIICFPLYLIKNRRSIAETI